MLRIVEARHVEGYTIYLRYENGTEGTVDFSNHQRTGLFAPWKDEMYFRSFSIPPETPVTLQWPNEADIAPEYLYAKVTGVPQQTAFAAMMACSLEIKRSVS